MQDIRTTILEKMNSPRKDDSLVSQSTALIVHPNAINNESVHSFSQSVSIEKFVSQSELNFLNFVHALIISDNKTKIDELKKNRDQFIQLKADVDANKVFDEDKSESGMTYVFLKSCIVNNLFTLCFGFDMGFPEQEWFGSPVKMDNFNKLKRVLELLFEIKLLSPSCYPIHQAISYEISRLQDLFLKKKSDHMFTDDDNFFAKSLLDDPEVNTLDYARTQYVEYLISSGLIDYTSCTIVCPNIFHLLIKRSPSGMLYFKCNPCILNEYMFGSKHGDGSAVAITFINVFFLCVYKHRINLLKMLLRGDFKNSKRLKRPLVFEIETKYSLRFDRYNGSSSMPRVEPNLSGMQEMTILEFAYRSGYTPPMMNILIEKIIEAYRDCRGHYDSDEDIKLKLLSMIMEHAVNVFFDLFFATVTAFPMFPQTPERWPELFKNLIPTIAHFESIFFVNSLRLGPLKFEKFTFFDVMAFAAFDEKNLVDYKPPDQPFNHFCPFFLPLVYVKLICNVCIYGLKKSIDFLSCLSENYLPGFFSVISVYVQKLMDAGFDSSDFMNACRMMIQVLDLQSKKDGRDPKILDQFADFFWYWVLREEMFQSNKLEEEQKRKEAKNEELENHCMFDEDSYSRKVHNFASLQEKRNLELLRKKQLQEENERKAALKKQEALNLKLVKEQELQGYRDAIAMLFSNDGIFTATEQNGYLKKLTNNNFHDLKLEIEKKREDRIQKQLLLKKKEEAKLLSKQQEVAAKVQYESTSYPAFLEAVEKHRLQNNVHVKNLVAIHSRHSTKFVEKLQVISNFMTVTLPELVENIRNLEEEEKAAAADAIVAAENTMDFLCSQRFHDCVKSLTFGTIRSEGLCNITISPITILNMEDYEDVFRLAFGSSSAELIATYLQILSCPNVNFVTKHLIPHFHFNVSHFKENEAGELDFLREFISKVIVIFSFLSYAGSKNDIFLVLKGSSAINYYAEIDSMDMDFSFSSSKTECTISFFERLSMAVCLFVRDLFASFYNRKSSFTIDHGSFKDSNNFCCTLRLGLFHVINKINCAYFNKHTKKMCGLPLADFNFGIAQNNRFRETKYSIVFNKESGSLVKVDKANRERNAAKTNLIHGSMFLPTLDALIEERLYYLVIYTRDQESINFSTLEKDMQTKRDPTLFYIQKTIKQLAILLKTFENPMETLKSSYLSVQRQETGFPDFELVSVFHHIL